MTEKLNHLDQVVKNKTLNKALKDAGLIDYSNTDIGDANQNPKISHAEFYSDEFGPAIMDVVRPGDIWHNTETNKSYVFDGTDWQRLPPADPMPSMIPFDPPTMSAPQPDPKTGIVIKLNGIDYFLPETFRPGDDLMSIDPSKPVFNTGSHRKLLEIINAVNNLRHHHDTSMGKKIEPPKRKRRNGAYQLSNYPVPATAMTDIATIAMDGDIFIDDINGEEFEFKGGKWNHVRSIPF